MYLLIRENQRYLVKKAKKKFHTKDGIIDLSKLKVGVIKSHLGKEFAVVKPNFLDLLLACKRGPQVILPKDAAMIAAYSGINPSSIIIDIGTGSGWLAAFLAHLVPDGHVYTYEKRKEFAKIAKNNFSFLGLKNITLKLKDARDGIDEIGDLVTVDIPDPWSIDYDAALKLGGMLAVYAPQLTQILRLRQNLPKNFQTERIIEIIERPWTVHGDIVRPRNMIIGHTAFLFFARKIK